MVQIKEDAHFKRNGSIDLEAWLAHLAEDYQYNNLQLIRSACLLSQLAGQDQATETGESCLQQGLAMAEILSELELDSTGLAASIVYESVLYADLSLSDIEEQLGTNVAKLVAGVERMSALNSMHVQQGQQQNHQQIDNVRKMLLSMVDDTRVVLIKLAERLRVLRTATHLSPSMQQTIAQECMTIYAPLANRLGIGHIKWEMEDLALRYLQPSKYKEIASGLKSRRVERDAYVTMIVDLIEQGLKQLGVKNFKVYGRSKHINSIYKKMQRKNVDLSQIFDATAVRVLVDELEDCYKVLGFVHGLWQQIPEEFDDYIVNVKPNGYQSLHTAVIGPEERTFEVQIRTYAMHDQAELGVAAHWKYKEGGGSASSHERKIAWLREVLDWQREVATEGETNNPLENAYFEDRVYVFTPAGDVIDLPQGATPLDFAYNIHSQVGHRCRGAKVNDNIKPLTYTLQTGDTVEVLTTKLPQPSRDWLNPHTGYVKTSRAKAKILHWFKQQDYDKNRESGAEQLDQECKKLAIKNVDLKAIAEHFHFKTGDDLLAAIGRGDVKLLQVVHKLDPKFQEHIHREPAHRAPSTSPKRPTRGDVLIEGAGDLLTHFAKCCQPLPGDDIIGYVTIAHGIAIHRKDCPNVLAAGDAQQARLINVNWSEANKSRYPVDIIIEAYDRHGLLRDLTAILTTEDANVLNLATQVSKTEHFGEIRLSIEITDLENLSRILDKIKQIQNVVDVRRVAK